jgi:hypothetical protein
MQAAYDGNILIAQKSVWRATNRDRPAACAPQISAVTTSWSRLPNRVPGSPSRIWKSQ